MSHMEACLPFSSETMYVVCAITLFYVGCALNFEKVLINLKHSTSIKLFYNFSSDPPSIMTKLFHIYEILYVKPCRR